MGEGIWGKEKGENYGWLANSNFARYPAGYVDDSAVMSVCVHSGGMSWRDDVTTHVDHTPRWSADSWLCDVTGHVDADVCR